MTNCRKCGHNNPTRAQTCSKCGALLPIILKSRAEVMQSQDTGDLPEALLGTTLLEDGNFLFRGV
ncbi:hypothetical protein ACQKWADRAFT_284205 [Trichoderma austrokoningii]